MGVFTSDDETVLVVDDCDDIRGIICMLMRRKGYRVVEAVNGKEAVELAARVNPQLILMDLGMPVLDGYEATRQILGRRETRDVPVVAVSGFCDALNRHKALDAGCVECVCKPVDFGVLDAVIQKYLHTH